MKKSKKNAVSKDSIAGERLPSTAAVVLTGSEQKIFLTNATGQKETYRQINGDQKELEGK